MVMAKRTFSAVGMSRARSASCTGVKPVYPSKTMTASFKSCDCSRYFKSSTGISSGMTLFSVRRLVKRVYIFLMSESLPFRSCDLAFSSMSSNLSASILY